LSDEKKTDSLQKALDEVRLMVARELPAIVGRFAEKAQDPKEASIKHAEFLVELLQAQSSAAVEKKGKMADTRKEEAENTDDGPSAIDLLLAELRQPLHPVSAVK
jgi:hypothetical protein